jgi:hypothetical protein
VLRQSKLKQLYNMEAIEFVSKYQNYITEIEQVVKPEYLPAIERLRDNDPHDLVRPESWFQSEADARGFVWTMFLREIRATNQP